jgi:hypothetical protein
MSDSQRRVVPGGGSGTATAFLLDSTFGSSVGRPRAQIVQAGRVRRRANGSEARAPEPFLACEVVTGHLWPGTPPQGLRLKNSGPFPWTEIQCLGLQSYSRLLGLSREKHHMLYPQQ